MVGRVVSGYRCEGADTHGGGRRTDLVTIRVEEGFEVDDVWVGDEPHYLELTVL